MDVNVNGIHCARVMIFVTPPDATIDRTDIRHDEV